MNYSVEFTQHAIRDLHELDEYIAEHDSPRAAEHVLESLEKSISALRKFPNKGAYPKELLALGIKEYREIFFKPYRIVYRVKESTVFLYLIADGRRDFQGLLMRRLLGAAL